MAEIRRQQIDVGIQPSEHRSDFRTPFIGGNERRRVTAGRAEPREFNPKRGHDIDSLDNEQRNLRARVLNEGSKGDDSVTTGRACHC